MTNTSAFYLISYVFRILMIPMLAIPGRKIEKLQRDLKDNRGSVETLDCQWQQSKFSGQRAFQEIFKNEPSL